KNGPAVVRTVLFESVRPGAANGGYYPFTGAASIYDYDSGYSKKRYYGQTCVGKMDAWEFCMFPGDTGGWGVQGRMTVSDRNCKDNAAEGVAIIPLAGVPGQPAPTTPVADSKTAAAPVSLYLGEYACYGTGGRLMAGMGFKLQAGGKYIGIDNAAAS